MCIACRMLTQHSLDVTFERFVLLHIKTSYNKHARENEIDVYTHRKITFMMQMLKHFMELELIILLL